MAVANLPGPVDTFFVYSTGSSMQVSQTFVWLLDLYGGSLGSYLPIALQNEILKYHRPFKGTPIVFISDFHFEVWTVDA